VARVLTHRRVSETRPAIEELLREARELGVVLRFDSEETGKHGLVAAEGLETNADEDDGVELCVVLGGDGTILTALRRYAGKDVPVFAVNFGEVGFLATVDRDCGSVGFRRALKMDFEVMELPGIELRNDGRHWMGINDVAIHRKPGNRVAELAYSVGGDEVGRVRCDGLVVATPAGSTGYNLANGGPIMAWGVEGFVVSFIAPHSLTARALVVAPWTCSRCTTPVQGGACGGRRRRPAVHGDLARGDTRRVVRGVQGLPAQLPGASFYGRLAHRFGRLTAAR